MERQLPIVPEIGKAEFEDDDVVRLSLIDHVRKYETFNRGAESSREVLTPIAFQHYNRQTLL